jgi:carbon monoxide dehydrogenase subunit G
VRTTFPVSAPAGAWAALADPQRLAAALRGCRSVTRDPGGDGTLHVVTEVAVASVRGLWAGTVAAVDADAVRIRGSGAPGTVDLVVRADTERTSLAVEGTVDGALGTVGAAVLAGAVRRMAEDLLGAETAGPGPSSRGGGSHQGEPEVMGSESGAHDLDRGSAEPIASGTRGTSGAPDASGTRGTGGAPDAAGTRGTGGSSDAAGAKGRRRAAGGVGGAALVGVVIAVVVRRRARGRAG